VFGSLRGRLARLPAAPSLAASAIGIAVATAPTASALGAWTAPKPLASSRVENYQQLIVQRDSAGASAIVWRREETLEEALPRVEAVTRQPGASWSSPAVLEQRRRGGDVALAAGIDEAGETTLAWQNYPEVGGGPRIEALSNAEGSRWSSPVRLSIATSAAPGAGEGEEPTLAILTDGEAAVAFTQSPELEPDRVRLAIRRGAGRWLRQRTVVAGRHTSFADPQLAALPGGRMILVWLRRGAGGHSYLQSVVLAPAGRRLDAVQSLSSPREACTGFRLATNASGEALLVWTEDRGRSRRVEASLRAPAGRFGAPARIAVGLDSELAATLDASGDATVLFTHLDHTQPAENEPGDPDVLPLTTATTTVQRSSRLAGGAWTSPAAIASAAGESTYSPQLAVERAGDRLVAVWESGRFQAWPPSSTRVQAATSPAPGSWQAPAVISPPSVGTATLAPLVADGRATVAWIASSEPDESLPPEYQVTETIEADEYEPG
jgi:hypothetical protein